MRSVISSCAKRLKALPKTLRVYRRNIEEMANIAACMLVQSMSHKASRRMRPVPIRIDEYRDRRR
ncbi:hypothetical protein [Bordetella sp. FB-8]|uniref:hypothetical protein n=1 Tax=Bordetella sp. FB-8 TaxID=1159870 RepID=UPI000378D348|nr:hypothetical protein [Bordetella sp. FB-8]